MTSMQTNPGSSDNQQDAVQDGSGMADFLGLTKVDTKPIKPSISSEVASIFGDTPNGELRKKLLSEITLGEFLEALDRWADGRNAAAAKRRELANPQPRSVGGWKR